MLEFMHSVAYMQAGLPEQKRALFQHATLCNMQPLIVQFCCAQRNLTSAFRWYGAPGMVSLSERAHALLYGSSMALCLVMARRCACTEAVDID